MASDLYLDGRPCSEKGKLDFDCQLSNVQADYVNVSGRYRLCMAAAENHTLNVSLNAHLGSYLQVPYDSSNDAGSIKVSVNGTEIGSVPAKHSDIWIRTVQFDTRAYRDQASSRLQIELQGGPLRCFDARVVP